MPTGSPAIRWPGSWWKSTSSRCFHRHDHGIDTAEEQGADSGELLAELGRCRERGYSVDDAENEPGIRGVGAPVLDYRSRPVAALSVAGPEQRVPSSRLDELGRATSEAARELSLRLGYSPRRSNPPR